VKFGSVTLEFETYDLYGRRQ